MKFVNLPISDEPKIYKSQDNDYTLCLLNKAPARF